MATTMNEIARWFDDGVKDNMDYMLVVVDTYDHEDYPVYATESDFDDMFHDHSGVNMQRIMEVYNLKMDKETQLREFRANNGPK